MWKRKTRADWLAGAVADVIPEVFSRTAAAPSEASLAKLASNIQNEELKLDFVFQVRCFLLLFCSISHANSEMDRKKKSCKQKPYAGVDAGFQGWAIR